MNKGKHQRGRRNQAAVCIGAKMWTQTSGTRSARACFTKCQCVREVAITVECAQYGRKLQSTQSEPVDRQRKRIANVESELKIEGAQGHEEVVRDQEQENIAARS